MKYNHEDSVKHNMLKQPNKRKQNKKSLKKLIQIKIMLYNNQWHKTPESLQLRQIIYMVKYKDNHVKWFRIIKKNVVINNYKQWFRGFFYILQSWCFEISSEALNRY